jgi:hypothetical protein
MHSGDWLDKRVFRMFPDGTGGLLRFRQLAYPRIDNALNNVLNCAV